MELEPLSNIKLMCLNSVDVSDVVAPGYCPDQPSTPHMILHTLTRTHATSRHEVMLAILYNFSTTSKGGGAQAP